jgi:hypothetical protein
MSYYTLAEDGRTPIKVENVMEWAMDMQKHASPSVDKTLFDIDGEKVVVSTVFLGLDHSFGGGPPLLWETMIFGGKHNDYQTRYTTYDEARLGHDLAVRLVEETR